MASKNINEHRTVHDYGLHAMATAAQAGDLIVCANPVTKLSACHKH